MKTQTAFRLSDECLRMLDFCAAQTNTNRTEIVVKAISLMFAVEIGKKEVLYGEKSCCYTK